MNEKIDLEKVVEVIDKHISYHNSRMDELKDALRICVIYGKFTDLGKYDIELESSASAIASLEMLKRELNGEVVY